MGEGDTVADAAEARLSGLGEELRMLLTDKRTARAFRLLRRPYVASELASQTLTVAARRAWSGSAAAGGTGPDLRGMLERDGSLTPQRLHVARAVVDSTVSVADFPSVPLLEQDLVLVLLAGLIRDANLPDEELVELIRTGEWRLARLAVNPRYRIGLRILALRRFVRQADLARRTDDGPAPRTVIGRYLKAIMQFDLAAVKKYDGGVDRESEVAVVEAAFTALVRRLFPAAPQPSQTAALAVRAAARCKSPLISPDEITGLIRAEFGAVDDDAELGPGERFSAKMAALAEMAEAYGLLLAEVRDLVVAAEQSAFQDGWQPTLVGA
ncbi:hypothetical protein AB0M46_08905 [Dactylosporangium sp. NPDC051485]|uniref:hypothetical protein n=1 Tax=Dactylosporangium sp. NPDC051485 TaxID=3154846 RepID=UPI003418A95C